MTGNGAYSTEQSMAHEKLQQTNTKNTHTNVENCVSVKNCQWMPENGCLLSWLQTHTKHSLLYFFAFIKRIQVSMLAPTIYPLTSKLILMNLPCGEISGWHEIFYKWPNTYFSEAGNRILVCESSYKSGGVVVLDRLGITEGLQDGIGLQQLFLQLPLLNNEAQHHAHTHLATSVKTRPYKGIPRRMWEYGSASWLDIQTRSQQANQENSNNSVIHMSKTHAEFQHGAFAWWISAINKNS